MPHFFEQQRLKLNLSQRGMAARLSISNETVRNWEADAAVPTPPIAELATAYEVTEQRMEREVMALRRRIEAKQAVASK
jgi:transcriptional regulator with XRE-family HTH domain